MVLGFVEVERGGAIYYRVHPEVKFVIGVGLEAQIFSPLVIYVGPLGLLGFWWLREVLPTGCVVVVFHDVVGSFVADHYVTLVLDLRALYQELGGVADSLDGTPYCLGLS